MVKMFGEQLLAQFIFAIAQVQNCRLHKLSFRIESFYSLACHQNLSSFFHTQKKKMSMVKTANSNKTGRELSQK